MTHRPKSLKTLLTLGLLGLCVAPILALSLYASGSVGSRARTEAAETLLDAGMQIAAKLDQDMHARWRDIALVATLVGAQGMIGEDGGLRVQLDALQRDVPLYAWIGAADTAGRVQVASQKILEGVDVSGRPWFRAATQAPFAGDVHEAVLLAQKLPPNPSGEPLRFVDIAMPLVRKDGVPLGVLGAHLSWTWTEEVTRSVLERNAGRNADAEAMVVSREGMVLMGPKDLVGHRLDIASVRAGAQGVARSLEETWPDGRTYITAVAPTRGEGSYRGLGWVVLIRRDVDVALAAASGIQRQLLVTGALTALLAGMAGLLLVGRVTRPLQAIARAASLAADGALSGTAIAPLPPTRVFAEATTLSASLTRLTAALAGRPVSASPAPRAPAESSPD